jgi:hypothetical protein
MNREAREEREVREEEILHVLPFFVVFAVKDQ